MHNRVFIIHGHQGTPDEHWLPWLRDELTGRGFTVIAPQMPNPDWPNIQEWVSTLTQLVGNPDERTFFVGHSLGAQAVLRYMQELVAPSKVGGALFIAGFEELMIQDDPLEVEQLREWFATPIHWEKIREKSDHFSAVFSDNDECVSVDNVNIFEEKLGAHTILLHNHGHFTAEDGITELPEALEEIMRMSGHSHSSTGV